MVNHDRTDDANVASFSTLFGGVCFLSFASLVYLPGGVLWRPSRPQARVAPAPWVVTLDKLLNFLCKRTDRIHPGHGD